MESTPEEAAEGLAIVRVLAAVLDRLVCANSALARNEPVQVTKFHALKAPGIGIQQYLERIHKYASCSSQCFIMALIYIDRLIQRNNFLLTELNVHRVIVTAILLAAKFFDDAYYNNAYYAKVGGVLVSEMNGLEVDFLFRINFSLHITPELFEQYRVELLSHSGLDSLPLPPPQYMDPMVNAPVAQQPQCLQQSQQPYGNGMGFPMPTGQPQMMPAHITPSPTRAHNQMTGTLPMHTVDYPVNPTEDEVMAQISQPLQSNLSHLLAQEFNYLQRANSMPLQPKPLGNPIPNQPQPLSAPAMMAMVPGVLNGNFPGLVDMAAAASNQQYVVVDNQVYPLPAVHCNHQDHRLMTAASNLLHHVHHPSHHVPGFVSREAAVSQRFATGQMVAGVSGGM
jgi:Cyclin